MSKLYIVNDLLIRKVVEDNFNSSEEVSVVGTEYIGKEFKDGEITLTHFAKLDLSDFSEVIVDVAGFKYLKKNLKTGMNKLTLITDGKYFNNIDFNNIYKFFMDKRQDKFTTARTDDGHLTGMHRHNPEHLTTHIHEKASFSSLLEHSEADHNLVLTLARLGSSRGNPHVKVTEEFAESIRRAQPLDKQVSDFFYSVSNCTMESSEGLLKGAIGQTFNSLFKNTGNYYSGSFYLASPINYMYTSGMYDLISSSVPFLANLNSEEFQAII